MGCIHNSPVVVIHSIKSFKKEAKKNLAPKKSEYPFNIDITITDEEDDTSHSSLEQSRIPIKAKMENNELIFL